MTFDVVIENGRRKVFIVNESSGVDKREEAADVILKEG